MPEIIYDKEDGLVLITEDGKTRKRTVAGEDVVVSLPPASTVFKKITNMYIEPVSGKLVVIYEK